MASALSEEPTFEEVLLHLHKVFNIETYRQISGAIFREIDKREEMAYREGKNNA